jgi:uncharacterized membrane protein YdbT with pleckstrin-like domain
MTTLTFGKPGLTLGPCCKIANLRNEFMPDTIVRPSRKWIRFGYTAASILVCVALFAYNNFFPEQPKWPILLALLLFLWPISADLRQRLTTMTITPDKLRYQTGLLSKTTETIPLASVQNVRVDQSLKQRLMQLGRISIETAGEGDPLVMDNVDDPQSVADAITDARQGLPAQTFKKKGDRS